MPNKTTRQPTKPMSKPSWKKVAEGLKITTDGRLLPYGKDGDQWRKQR